MKKKNLNKKLAQFRRDKKKQKPYHKIIFRNIKISWRLKGALNY